MITLMVTRVRDRYRCTACESFSSGGGGDFDGRRRNPHLPRQLPHNMARLYMYPRTNNTTRGWYEIAGQSEAKRLETTLAIFGRGTKWTRDVGWPGLLPLILRIAPFKTY